MKTIRPGDSGIEVDKWQMFLIGQGFGGLIISSDFDEPTEKATKIFQSNFGLTPDSIVGPGTIAKAKSLGFIEENFSDYNPDGYPPKPGFSPFTTTEQRAKAFGTFAYVPAPTPSNPEAIRITGDWEKSNIVNIAVPELSWIPGCSGHIQLHQKVQEPFKSLIAELKEKNLIDSILSWDDSFVPRFIRGSRTYLSIHPFGTAFDINARWNPLGVKPVGLGQKGTVFPIVEIANKYGFYWGGHFDSRPDGMHFEFVQV